MKNTKDRKKAILIASIVFLAIGVLGLFGLGTSDDKASLLIGCLLFIAVGAILFVVQFKIKKKEAENNSLVVNNSTNINQADGLSEIQRKALDRAFGNDRKDEKVKVYFDDGTIEEYNTYCTKVSNPEWCLVADGGEKYHLRYGCFHNWPEEYQKSFAGWKAMKISEAEEKGMTLCRYCEKADGALDFDDLDDDSENTDYLDDD